MKNKCRIVTVFNYANADLDGIADKNNLIHCFQSLHILKICHYHDFMRWGDAFAKTNISNLIVEFFHILRFG